MAVHFYHLSIDLELWGWQRKAGRRGDKIRFIFLLLLLMIIIIVNILAGVPPVNRKEEACVNDAVLSQMRDRDIVPIQASGGDKY